MIKDSQSPQADTRKPTSENAEQVSDLRGQTTTKRDLSEHRRHQWLYEDLLA